MKIIDAQYPIKNTVITIGTFDGVHRGHQQILNILKQRAFETKLNDLVITFRLPPRLILNPNAPMRVLTLIDEKIELLNKQHVKNLYILPFDKNTAQMDAETFVRRFLVEKFGLKHLIVGYDHRFGKDRQAGYEQLLEIGKKYGFTVEQVQPVKHGNLTVSSSLIRNALQNGDIKLANDLLGYNYFFRGKVIQGKRLGKKLSYPTANLRINPLKLMPKLGVYAVRVESDDFSGYGVLNYGLRPTIDHDTRPAAEVHILDFNRQIYGKTLRISLVQRLRDELKFSSLHQLSKQIAIDIAQVRKIFGLEQ